MPPKISPTKGKKKGARRRKIKTVKVPRFTSEQLNEEIDIFLTTYNPYMSENCVEFDRKTKSFKPILDYRKPVLVMKCQGTMKRKLPEGEEILYGEFGENEEQEERMRNKFNFRSVASQTIRIHPLECGNQIDPSLFPVLKFKGTASKAEIMASYENHEKKKKERENYTWIQQALRKIVKYVGQKSTPLLDYQRKYLRLCERMLDQNSSEANLDYSYYDNPNDEFRTDAGSLLPLWNFSCELTRGLAVTSIAWSEHFSDLFAVGFRIFKEEEADDDDMGRMREEGYLCIYSLKGPNHPEKTIQCRSAVKCLSFHPEWSHLLAVGGEGGNLDVFDLRKERSDPAEVNCVREEILHHDTVSELRWLPGELPQKFCTVSADGNILRWQLAMNDVFPFDVVTSLQIKDWSGEVPPMGIETETPSKLDKTLALEMDFKMAGLSLSSNPHARDIFAVGTDTGVIYECSFDDKLKVQDYQDHKHSVARVLWNPYHQRVFLSSSEDMTVRIWDHSLNESVFEFFFENEVRDASWAPFSSTLFSVITGNSVVYAFDLAVNKGEAIGNYVVYTAKENVKLTTVCFHPSKPVLMVGDEKGHVISFKLSPNLRSSYKAMETLDKSKYAAAEEEKMEKLLAPAKGRIRQSNQ